ncbi:alpha/beta fold hydrolase [Streptomyces olindensis]|uniref:alpha/beta fold hydrolase n=1 Tax=Streptomyces olindensis TaxID=358823 RepID=UPI0036695497
MPRTTRLAGVAAVGLLAALAVLVAEGATASTTPSAVADHPARLDRFYGQHPAWRRCDTDTPASYQCATITVPVDYAHPEGRTLHLRISRIRTSTPAKRHGVLLSNPGGPGDQGLADPLQLKDALAKSVLQRYDLVGFDPRGLGASSPLHCGLTQDETQPSEPYRPYRAATFAKDTADARAVAAKCTNSNGSQLLPYINTRNTARDMDVIRGVLGERKLSYIGWSYGTYLGAVYTQLFPRHSDRMVLDSAVDPNRFGRGLALAMASGAEPAFKDWSRLIAHRDRTYHLGNTPAKVRATFWQLVARADRTPLLHQGATRVDNTVGALVVQNQWDPQTPLSSGRAMHHALHGSRLVYVRGGRGHAVYALPGAPTCVTRTVDAYLTGGHLPTTDVTCDASAR